MMRFNWVSVMISCALTLSACASIERLNREQEKKVSAEFLRHKCNPQYFYQDGMNDAMGGVYMNSDDVTRYCKKKDFAQLRNSYTKGYQAGMRTLQSRGSGSGTTGSTYAAELPSCSLGARYSVQCTDKSGQPFQFDDSGCSVKCDAGKPTCEPAGCEYDRYGRATGFGHSSTCSCN